MSILFLQGLVISDAVWVALIITVPVLLSGGVNAYLKIQADRRQEKARKLVAEKVDAAADKAAEAASKVAEVKVALAQSDTATIHHLQGLEAGNEKLQQTSDKIHTLVNSNMGVQLKLNAAVTKRLADITKDDDDRKAADLAAVMLAEHEKKQETVDANAANEKK